MNEDAIVKRVIEENYDPTAYSRLPSVEKRCIENLIRDTISVMNDGCRY